MDEMDEMGVVPAKREAFKRKGRERVSARGHCGVRGWAFCLRSVGHATERGGSASARGVMGPVRGWKRTQERKEDAQQVARVG